MFSRLLLFLSYPFYCSIPRMAMASESWVQWVCEDWCLCLFSILGILSRPYLGCVIILCFWISTFVVLSLCFVTRLTNAGHPEGCWWGSLRNGSSLNYLAIVLIPKLNDCGPCLCLCEWFSSGLFASSVSHKTCNSSLLGKQKPEAGVCTPLKRSPRAHLRPFSSHCCSTPRPQDSPKGCQNFQAQSGSRETGIPKTLSISAKKSFVKSCLLLCPSLSCLISPGRACQWWAKFVSFPACIPSSSWLTLRLILCILIRFFITKFL